MSATIIVKAVEKALSWLATRGKTVSRHIRNHTRRAANVARTNPRYVARALGRSAHSIFRDPRPRKLVEQVLKKYDNALLQSGGRVLVEKQFNRVVGKGGETIVRVIINSRTGRIITAFPVAAFATAATAFPAVPEETVGATFDERLVETIEGLERLALEWEARRSRPRENIWTFLIDLLLDPSPAGDPDEELHVRAHAYMHAQAEAMIRELEQELGQPIAGLARQKLREQFFDAVVGVTFDMDDEW